MNKKEKSIEFRTKNEMIKIYDFSENKKDTSRNIFTTKKEYIDYGVEKSDYIQQKQIEKEKDEKEIEQYIKDQKYIKEKQERLSNKNTTTIQIDDKSKKIAEKQENKATIKENNTNDKSKYIYIFNNENKKIYININNIKSIDEKENNTIIILKSGLELKTNINKNIIEKIIKNKK